MPPTLVKIVNMIQCKECIRLFVLIGLLMLAFPCQAADELGAELTYQCQDPANRLYTLQVTRYYACGNGGSVTSPTLSFTGSCAVPSPAGPWQATGTVDVTPLCPGIPTRCQGSPSPVFDGFEAHVYERTYDFSAAASNCNDFMVHYLGCCRSGQLDNGAAGERRYLTVGPIDPFACNQAPEFLFSPLILLDTATEAQVAWGANDPDGDSLAYRLVSCLDTAAQPISYGSNFGASSPLGSNWNVQIDAQSGNLSFVPNPGGSVLASLCVEVLEYREGTLISTYTRDMQVEATPDLPPQPSANLPSLHLPSASDSIWGGDWIGNYVVEASIGEPIIFELEITDPEGDSSTQVSWTQNLPGLDFYNDDDPVQVNTIIGKDPTVEIRWTPWGRGNYKFGLSLADTSWCGALHLRDYSLLIHVQDTSFLAAFEQDTLYMCPGDSLTVSPRLYGIPPQSPPVYTWNTGSLADSLLITQPGSYQVDVLDTVRSRSSSASLTVLYADHCVWPGDADNDGIANHFDVLALGLGYGATGPPRLDQGIDWSGKQAVAWADTLPDGQNIVYANTNGDGIIDVEDTLAISLNYELTHQKRGQRSSGSPIFLQSPVSTVRPGDSVSIAVHLGTLSVPSDSILGIAFSVTYDNSLVDSASAHFVVPASWLGNPASDLFSMQKDLFGSGMIDLGMSRNDHSMRANHGQIARLDIVMVDDLIGKRAQMDSLRLTIENIRAIDVRGQEVEIASDEGLLLLVDVSTGLSGALPSYLLSLAPNPSQGKIKLQSQAAEGLDIYVYDMQGKLRKSLSQFRGTQIWNLADWPAGIYLLEARNTQGRLSKKIILNPN
jgi:hypothetical protein